MEVIINIYQIGLFTKSRQLINFMQQLSFFYTNIYIIFIYIIDNNNNNKDYFQ